MINIASLWATARAMLIDDDQGAHLAETAELKRQLADERRMVFELEERLRSLTGRGQAGGSMLGRASAPTTLARRRIGHAPRRRG